MPTPVYLVILMVRILSDQKPSVDTDQDKQGYEREKGVRTCARLVIKDIDLVSTEERLRSIN